MDMLPEDQKVIDLLTKLKRSHNGYPSDMLAARREMYIKQVASAGLGLGAGSAIKNALRGSNGTGAATTVTSKILEIVLVVAITAEAGTVAYLYRDKISEALNSYTGSPTVSEVVNQPAENITAPEATEVLQTPLAESSETPSVTPSGTPVPALAGEATTTTNNNDNNGTNITTNINATPQPTNQGNQYGLTPKPARTKENNSDNNNGGGNDNNNGNSGGNAP